MDKLAGSNLFKYYLYRCTYWDLLWWLSTQIGIEVDPWVFVQSYDGHVIWLIWYSPLIPTVIRNKERQDMTLPACLFPFQFINATVLTGRPWGVL